MAFPTKSASAAGFPFINPYNDVKANHENGVNFAVAGSTALSISTLASHNIIPFVTNTSLNGQLGWMSRHFSSLCNTKKDCREKFKSSLFMVGEIGGNDYNFALNPKITIEEVNLLVPKVVQAIIKATKRVIKHYGASKVVVPGNFPIGCFPIYQTLFQTNVSEAYDSNHCLKDLNNLAENHNELLQEKLAKLQKERPGTTIIYGDYHNAFKWLFTSAPQLGFDATTTQKACCGFGGEYNFNPAYICGDPRVHVPVCSNPTKYISWDGIHLTDAAYQKMTTWLIENSLSALNCRS